MILGWWMVEPGRERPTLLILREKFVTKQAKIIGALLLAGFALQGCATVTRGTTEAFVVETDPAGARVETSNGMFCQMTPCSMKMKRKAEFDVTITLDGYHEHVSQVTHQMSGAGGVGLAGNVLVGGLIGLGVDAYTGSSQELVPNPLVVKLTPNDQPMPEVPMDDEVEDVVAVRDETDEGDEMAIPADEKVAE